MPEYAWPNLVTMFFDQAEKHGDKPFLLGMGIFQLL